ncbi:MAG: SGNH/GDSL hydrolase family protein [Clostridia bacterium]|nr:SGNH/GDSL hydrolase family protein [Clostridia bacterium]
MVIDGKVCLFLGDSITEGVGASSVEKCFVSLIQHRNMEASVYNFGVGGTRIAPQHEVLALGGERNDFNYRAQFMPEGADLVCVFGGTNDYWHGDAPFGKFGDRTSETFCGSLYTLSEYLINRYPNARIVFFTPLHRNDEFTLVPKADGEFTLRDYVNAIKQNAEYFSFPVLDLWQVSGIQPCVEIMQKEYMPDGLHPNDKGYERLASLVQKFIENL